MPTRRHTDPLVTFSHRLFQIKFVIVELVVFVGFLMFVWDKVKHDFLPAHSNPSSSHTTQKPESTHQLTP